MSSREKILDSAAALIHTRGFHHTSIQDILEAASVTKSNFYYHFESKEQLAFEVLGERMRQFYAATIGPSLENPSLNPRQRIELFLDNMKAIGCSKSGELGCPFGNLAQEISYRQRLRLDYRRGAILANLVCLVLLIRFYRQEGLVFWEIFRIQRESGSNPL